MCHVFYFSRERVIRFEVPPVFEMRYHYIHGIASGLLEHKAKVLDHRRRRFDDHYSLCRRPIRRFRRQTADLGLYPKIVNFQCHAFFLSSLPEKSLTTENAAGLD